MESKPSVPQTPSKIPKLVTPTSTLSPRGRTPSFIMGEALASPPAAPVKAKSRLSSPRQPISFRVQGTPSTPNSPRLIHQHSSITSKSNDETTRHSGGGAAIDHVDALPDVVEDDPAAIATQGGEGDMPSPLAIRADPSAMKVKSQVFSLKQMESRLACTSADVNVLYAASPMRMDSIVSVSTPTPPQKESATYLDLYEQERRESLETIRSVQDLGSNLNMSLEWDFNTGGVADRHESFTQTSGILVGTVDRASSANPLPSFSKESLLDLQTSPLSVLEGLTTEEDEGENDVSDEMSTYAYDCFAHEVEGDEKEYEFSPLITVAPVESEVVVKKTEKKLQSQFTPRCYMDEARYQEMPQDYESNDEGEVKEVFSLEIPMEPEPTFLDETPAERGDGDGGTFMATETEDLREEVLPVPEVEMTLPSASLPRQRSLLSSQAAIAPENADNQSTDYFPRQQSSRRSQHAIAPEIAQSSASVPRQRSSVHRLSQNSDGTQKLATSSVSVPQQRSSRSVYQDAPEEPRVTQAQSSASVRQPSESHQPKSPKTPLPEWQVENLRPRLGVSASGVAIEIQPPPVQLLPDDLMNLTWRHEEKSRLSGRPEAVASRESTSIFSPVSSRIILEQWSANFGKGMRGSLELSNSTAFPQGFKVMSNQATKRDLKFTPDIGLIPPHEKITVQVSSLDSAICTPHDAGNYCVWVHMFRAFCKDGQELKEFYSNLERQRPELIQTSQINNFVIWNKDDLPGMLEMVNSVHDEMEKEELMREIHRHQSSTELCNESTSMDRLDDLQCMMAKSNGDLKELGKDLGDLRNSAQLFLFIALMIYGMVFLLPYMHEVRVVPEPAPTVPQADCTTGESSSWMPSWDDMREGMNQRMRNFLDYF